MRKIVISALVLILVFSVVVLSGCSSETSMDQPDDITQQTVDSTTSDISIDSQIDSEIDSLSIDDTNPYEVGEMI